jgi:hypothetical protein
MTIKLIVIAGLASALVFARWWTPRRQIKSAWAILLILCFITLLAFGFALPDFTASLAEVAQVRNGTDLLVYFLFLAWVLTLVVAVKSAHQYRLELARTVSEVAILRYLVESTSDQIASKVQSAIPEASSTSRTAAVGGKQVVEDAG